MTTDRLDAKIIALGSLDYSYYANGLLEDVVSTNPGGVNIGYRYDEANRLAFVDDASSGTTGTAAYTYNANGSLETVTAPNGIAHGYAYDSLNRLRSLSVANIAAQILRSTTYAVTPSGHRHIITETTGRTATYDYDGVYRLTSEVIAGAGAQNGTVGYTLDKVGNRLNRTSSVSSVPATSDGFNSRDQLSSDSYDANGNTTLATGVTTQDIYDFEDRLIIRRNPDGSSINLSYDADGIRRQKTLLNAAAQFVSATGYLTDTNNLTGYAQVVEEFRNNAAGLTSLTYTYGSDLISVLRVDPNLATSTSYFGYDGLGSVRFLTNASGVVTDTWDYDAFGNVLGRTGTTENNYLYRGEQFDPDLGMYSLRARFYNQSTGRFWNQDSYEGSSGDPMSLHKYLYANADGVNNCDPSGHVSLAEIKIAMVIVGTINGMAVNSARNTLGQGEDIFSPTGEVAESITTLSQAMFVYEWLNYAAAGVGGGLLAKQGVITLWTKIGPKLGKAMDALGRASPTKIFKATLGNARAQSLRVSSLFEKRAVIGNYSAEGIGGYGYLEIADAIGAAKFKVDDAIWRTWSKDQKLGANVAALDQFVAEGRTILVATPQHLMRLVDKSGGPSWLKQEFDYLLKRYGLVLSNDGTRMVPHGGNPL